MAASSYYTDKELFKKNSSEKQEMLFQKGINFNDYPYFFRHGTYVQKRKVSKIYTAEEATKLPVLHNARRNSCLEVGRNTYLPIDMQISKVSNATDVIFRQAERVLRTG